jgi:hypothetical protein
LENLYAFVRVLEDTGSLLLSSPLIVSGSQKQGGGDGLGLGKVFKDLSEGEASRIEGLPKDLGQLKKAQVSATGTKGNKKR